MKHRGLVLFLLVSGCGASSTAYRGHFESESDVAALRECARACDLASAQGEDVHTCLSACPGFVATPGERCEAGREKPGTYCVTVLDRLVPDGEFWGAVASAAVDAALERRDDDDDDDDDDDPDPGSSSAAKGSRSSAAPRQSRTPARPSARPPSSSRKNTSRSSRRP